MLTRRDCLHPLERFGPLKQAAMHNIVLACPYAAHSPALLQVGARRLGAVDHPVRDVSGCSISVHAAFRPTRPAEIFSGALGIQHLDNILKRIQVFAAPPRLCIFVQTHPSPWPLTPLA